MSLTLWAAMARMGALALAVALVSTLALHVVGPGGGGFSTGVGGSIEPPKTGAEGLGKGLN